MHVFAVGKCVSLGGRTTTLGLGIKPASVAGRLYTIKLEIPRQNTGLDVQK